MLIYVYSAERQGMANSGSLITFPGGEISIEETLLLNRLRSLKNDQKGYYVVHMHLSKLRPGNRKPHFIKIATRNFEDLLANFNVTLYCLSTDDIVLLCRDVPVEEIDPVIQKTRQLFSEDPLTDGEDGSPDDKFTTWYDFANPADLAAFVDTANELTVQALQQKAKPDENRPANTLPGTRLDPSSTADIRLKLQRVNMEDLIDEQTCIVVYPDEKGKVMFREKFVSMRALQQRVAPDVNLFGSPWLFLYLTETVDRRLLAIVSQGNFASLKNHVSLNLNISSVLGREFQHFHQCVGNHTDKVVIEFQLIDVFSDMNAYGNARDMLQDNGYRVLIDGLSPLSLQFFDPSLLLADLIKINWGQEFINDDAQDRIDDMRGVIKSMGKDNVILARTDSEDAVKWALSLGITRFQGFYIDNLVNVMQLKGII